MRFDEGDYIIELNWTADWSVLRDFVLPHEYAHARAWARLQPGIELHDHQFYLHLHDVDVAAETMQVIGK